MSAKRKSISELQEIIESRGYKLLLLSSEGTQQNDPNNVCCLGCDYTFTTTGDVLYRRKKNTRYPGCLTCQKIERTETQQERLDSLGKRVDILTYQGSTQKDLNLCRCRDCGNTYRVNGRVLTRQGNPTPGCEPCKMERKRQHAKDILVVHNTGPRYGIEEAQQKFESIGKPGKGNILEWNGTTVGSRESITPAHARFRCECGREFDTFGTTIMNPKCTYNGCPKCGPEASRQANLKYDIDSVKAAIVQNQTRNVLDLSGIESFNTVNDRVSVRCKKHDILCEHKHLWALMNGSSPCPKCRAEMIGNSQSADWIETEEKMREIEGANIRYFPSTYISRNKKMRKLCTKTGHNPDTDGVFWQAPKQTIVQGSSCPDCGVDKTAGKRRLPVDILLTQFRDAHGDFYEYPSLEENYVNDRTPIPIICPSHGIFKQSPGGHKIGNGCPECVNSGKRSMFEVKLMFEIGQFFPQWEPNNIQVPGYAVGDVGPVDSILSFVNKIICEYDCYYWHQSDSRVKSDHNKTSTLVTDDWKVYRVRSGEIPDIEGAINIRVPARENLKQYADAILSQMIKDGVLNNSELLERYLEDNLPWLESEARDWFYSNCRRK